MNGIEEESRIALLCLGYLAFDCFDAGLPADDVREYLMEGYYAFQDYAVAHWIDHVEASVDSSNGPCPDHEALAGALSGFFSRHWRDASARDKPVTKTVAKTGSKFRELAGYDIHNQLLQVVHYSKKTDALAAGSDADPLELTAAVRRIRSVFEETAAGLAKATSDEAETLRSYYGLCWFKCPRQACARFHDGFRNARERDQHVDQHTRPYRCTVPGCVVAALGCPSERSLKQHNAQYHSGVESLFPAMRAKATKPSKAELARLFPLASYEDVNALKQRHNIDLLTVVHRRETLLHVAAKCADTEMAKLILDSGKSGSATHVPTSRREERLSTTTIDREGHHLMWR